MEDIPYDELVGVISSTKQRMQEISAQISEITVQLNDPLRAKQMGDTYQEWRTRALYARGAMFRDAGQLKTKLTQYNKMENLHRQRMGALRREQRLKEHAERMQSDRRILGSNDPTSLLITRLLAALDHLYRATKAPVSDEDRKIMFLAHAYLESESDNA